MVFALGAALALGIAVGVGALAPLEAVALAAVPFALVTAMRKRRRLPVYLLLAALLFMRPALLGEDLTPLAMILAAAGAIVVGFEDAQRWRVTRTGRAFLTTVAVTNVWIVVATSVHPALSSSDALRGLATVLVIVGAAAVILRDAERRELFTAWLTGALVVLCASYAATFLLWRFSGFRTTPLATINAGRASAAVFFPFTATSGAFQYGGIQIPRFSGFMREPGLLPAFLIWGWFAVQRRQWSGKRRTAAKVLLLLGIAGTQSVAGFGAFLVAWGVATFLVRKPWRSSASTILRRTIGLALVPLAAWVALNAPVFGVEARRTNNEASVVDRRAAAELGIERALQSPVGTGSGAGEANAAINLLGAMSLFGLPILILETLVYFRPLRRSRLRFLALPATLGFYVTGLVSQPLISAPFVYIALMAALDPVTPDEERFVADNNTRGRTKKLRVRAW